MKALLISAIVATIASPALAADIAEVTAEPLVTPWSWTGFYIGAHGGYSWTDPKFKVFGGEFEYPATESHDDRFIGGVQAGYNHQWNWLVAGVVADISTGGGSADYVYKGSFAEFSYKEKFSGTLRANLGVAHDRWMAYATGGLAFASINAKICDGRYCESQPVENHKKTYSETETGYVLGAGISYALTDNIVLGTEYLYKDFGKLPVVGPIPAQQYEGFADWRSHQLRFLVNYKF